MADSKEPLSERELEILKLVATGAANKEIARQLVISPNTVKVHMRNIFAKVGVTSRTEATLYALKVGLVTPGTVPEAAALEGLTEPDDLSSPAQENPKKSVLAVDAGIDGFPGITIEDNDRRNPMYGAGKNARLALKPWQIGLILLAALALIGAGMIGSRWLSPTAPVATVTSRQAAPATVLQRWVKRTDLPAARKGMGIAEYENSFYIFAGETKQGLDGATLRYDLTNNNWQVLAKKPTPVTDVQAALIGEKIYVPGGRLPNGTATDRLEVFNPRQGTWESKASLPTPLSAYALASFEGELYLFGGKNGSQYSAAVYHYDPKEDRWDTRTALSVPRAYAAAVTSGEKILVIGGFDGKKALTLNESYFPPRDRDGETPWQSESPLTKGRYAMGIAHLASMIYLVGGLDAANAPASPAALQYAAQSDQWLAMDAPPAQVGAYPALFASGNYLYVFGGESPKGLLAMNLAYQAIYTISVPLLQNEPSQ